MRRPPPERLGDAAVRLARLPGEEPARLLAAARSIPGVAGAVVTEDHLALHLGAAPPADPAAALEAALEAVAAAAAAPREHRIRVRYDGPDLERVARHAGVSAGEVAALHAAPAYTVLFLGFLPGFAY